MRNLLKAWDPRKFSLSTWLVIFLIDKISLPLVIVDFFKRHVTIRVAIFWITVSSVLIAMNFGIAVLVGIGSLVVRMAFSMVMMIGQFVVLFSFLSSTKTIEMYPGDTGMFTFDKDYFGGEYLVEAVQQWVSSLSKEGKTTLDAMGAEAINGLLLEGPPGTGKTLLAQCLASWTHAAFFGCSGTDFQAMFIGVGPMKVMRMYGKARAAAARYGASIIFIDEIDSIGGSRGGVSGGVQAGGVQAGGLFGGGGLGVLSKLLTEMDGTKEIGRRDRIRNRLRAWFGIPALFRGLVLTIGATNRIGVLDPALTRPGRIDKVITVDPPDNRSRAKIIEGYLGKVKHDDSVNVEALTEDTQGVTPAQLASAIQRSAPRHAINDKRDYIVQSDIDAALQEDLVGLRNPIADFDPEQKRQVTVHEAGHALLSWLLLPERRITHVSIVRRGSGILGYVRGAEKKEMYAAPLTYHRNRICVAAAGHVAVDVIMGEPWTGASADFDHVRFYLKEMAMAGEFGGIPFNPVLPFENDQTKVRADEALQGLLKRTYQLINANRPAIDALIEVLAVKEELSSTEVYEILSAFEPVKEVSGDV